LLDGGIGRERDERRIEGIIALHGEWKEVIRGRKVGGDVVEELMDEAQGGVTRLRSMRGQILSDNITISPPPPTLTAVILSLLQYTSSSFLPLLQNVAQ
jgi:hypothetical protein